MLFADACRISGVTVAPGQLCRKFSRHHRVNEAPTLAMLPMLLRVSEKADSEAGHLLPHSTRVFGLHKHSEVDGR